DVLASTQSGFENFDGGDAPLAVFFRQQALGNNVPESLSEPGADALLIALRKNTNNAFDGFGGIDGAKRGHDQVPGFSRFESNLNRFTIAHLTDENDFGSLAQGSAESQRKGRRIAMKLALVNGGFLVPVQKFDGVFDGEDMECLVGVHLVDDGGECGGFARASGAGNQDDAVPQVHDFFQL